MKRAFLFLASCSLSSNLTFAMNDYNSYLTVEFNYINNNFHENYNKKFNPDDELNKLIQEIAKIQMQIENIPLQGVFIGNLSATWSKRQKDLHTNGGTQEDFDILCKKYLDELSYLDKDFLSGCQDLPSAKEQLLKAFDNTRKLGQKSQELSRQLDTLRIQKEELELKKQRQDVDKAEAFLICSECSEIGSLTPEEFDQLYKQHKGNREAIIDSFIKQRQIQKHVKEKAFLTCLSIYGDLSEGEFNWLYEDCRGNLDAILDRLIVSFDMNSYVLQKSEDREEEKKQDEKKKKSDEDRENNPYGFLMQETKALEKNQEQNKKKEGETRKRIKAKRRIAKIL